MKISTFEIEFQDGSICVTSCLDAKDALGHILAGFPDVHESAIKEVREIRVDLAITRDTLVG